MDRASLLLLAMVVFAGCPKQTPGPAGSSGGEVGRAAPPPQADVDLLRSTLKRRGAEWSDAQIEIKTDDVPCLPLPGLSLFRAWPMVPDALAESCFTFDGNAWCNDEESALDRVVTAFDLAKQPRKLSGAEWIGLVTFVHASRVLKSPDDAKRTVSSAPEAVASKVAPPSATIEDGRVVVRFFTAIIANDVGPVGISECEVAIAGGPAKKSCKELHKKL